MLIKVCGLKYPGNIEAVLKLQPDFVGFNFYSESPRHVNEATLDIIRELNYGNTKVVGVFVNEEPEVVIETGLLYALDYVQLHGNEWPDQVREIRKSFSVIKAVGIESKEDMEKVKEYDEYCNFILLDKKSPLHGGTGIPFNWNLIDSYSSYTPFFLAGGLSLENIKKASTLKHPLFEGIDLNSGFEDGAGMKNIDKLIKGMEIVRGKKIFIKE